MTGARPQRIDTDALLAGVDLVAVVGRFVDLKRSGSEYQGLCPFHGERTPSFTVVPSRGFVHCFGCGAHHDAIGFVMAMTGCDFREACEQLGHREFAPAIEQRVRREPPKPGAQWRPLIPVPDDVPDLMRADGRTVPLWNPKPKPPAHPAGRMVQFRPTRVDEYRGFDGRLLGYVLRLEFDGKKITPVITWCVGPDGAQQWCMRPFPDPRPMQGLDALADPHRVAIIATASGRQRYALVAPGELAELVDGERVVEVRDRTVLVVEGEKCRAAGAGALPQYAVVTWPGGSKGIGHVDWSPLKGRDVVLWPDADESGQQAMLGWTTYSGLLHRGVAQHAHRAGAARLRMIDTSGMPKGWDIADAIADEWTPPQLLAWAANRLVELSVETQPERPAK